MKFLYNFFPVILFFVVYKISNIYTATIILMIASFVQTFGYWIRHRKFEKMHLISFIVISILGTITLLLHDPIFIKWKPTIVSWLFSIIFLGSQLFLKKPALYYLMAKTLSLSKSVLNYLNLSWALFFLAIGFINLYVAYHYNTNIWVNFKLFGIVGATFLFGSIQSIVIAYVIKNERDTES